MYNLRSELLEMLHSLQFRRELADEFGLPADHWTRQEPYPAHHHTIAVRRWGQNREYWRAETECWWGGIKPTRRNLKR